jgi:hypothetical protein
MANSTLKFPNVKIIMQEHRTKIIPEKYIKNKEQKKCTGVEEDRRRRRNGKQYWKMLKGTTACFVTRARLNFSFYLI